MRLWRVAFATLGVVGYACSLTRDVDEHSSLPPCTPRTCEDFVGRCGTFVDPCSGIADECPCLIPADQDCTGGEAQLDSGVSSPDAASSDAASDASSPNSEPPGYCVCRGQTGCQLFSTVTRRAGDATEMDPGKDWNNVRGILPDTTGCAEVTLPPGAQSKYLLANKFDFASEIPSGSCVIGISVTMSRSADRASVRDGGVQLMVDGNMTGDVISHIGENWTTDDPEPYGGCRINWGECWNDVVTQPGFGVAIRVQNTANSGADAKAKLCRVDMQVYFTKPDCSESCPECP